MKTTTLRKGISRTGCVLTIALFIFSCKNEKTINAINSNEPKELALITENIIDIPSAINSSLEIQQDKDTKILLTVDTKTINQNNIDSKVVFSDDRSDPNTNPGNPKTFTSRVDKNMKVYWSAVPKDVNSTETVDVMAIYRKPEGGAEILENTFKDPNKDGIIIGKIKNKNVSGLEFYSVLIRINGDTIKTFLVDPKLEMGGN
jgi:hypothetical protein